MVKNIAEQARLVRFTKEREVNYPYRHAGSMYLNSRRTSRKELEKRILETQPEAKGYFISGEEVIIYTA